MPGCCRAPVAAAGAGRGSDSRAAGLAVGSGADSHIAVAAGARTAAEGDLPGTGAVEWGTAAAAAAVVDTAQQLPEVSTSISYCALAQQQRGWTCRVNCHIVG
jgi:hypothetical protein